MKGGCLLKWVLYSRNGTSKFRAIEQTRPRSNVDANTSLGWRGICEPWLCLSFLMLIMNSWRNFWRSTLNDFPSSGYSIKRSFFYFKLFLSDRKINVWKKSLNQNCFKSWKRLIQRLKLTCLESWRCGRWKTSLKGLKSKIKPTCKRIGPKWKVSASTGFELMTVIQTEKMWHRRCQVYFFAWYLSREVVSSNFAAGKEFLPGNLRSILLLIRADWVPILQCFRLHWCTFWDVCFKVTCSIPLKILNSRVFCFFKLSKT